MRLGVYNDYAYHEDGGTLYGERAFDLFLGELAEGVDGLVLAGRLRSGPSEQAHYPLSDRIEFVGLPHYETMSQPLDFLRAVGGSLRGFWRLLGQVDRVWLLGPHPLCLALALLAAVRRRPVALGVRQAFPRYVRARYPGRRWIHAAGDLLEAMYRLLARACPTVVVGPELARDYRRARRLAQMSVSLVREGEIPLEPPPRSYDGELRVMSIGRLEAEKNPLLLADVLAELRDGDPRWRLVVCGEGPMEAALAARLAELGLSDHADLCGYVPLDGGLLALYRSSHLLLHVSWTEGVPQILFEAFAAGLPVVATAVGGVPEAVGDDALLVPAGDAGAAADALRRLAGDGPLRARHTRGGLARIRDHTLEAESARVARFLSGR